MTRSGAIGRLRQALKLLKPGITEYVTIAAPRAEVLSAEWAA